MTDQPTRSSAAPDQEPTDRQPTDRQPTDHRAEAETWLDRLANTDLTDHDPALVCGIAAIGHALLARTDRTPVRTPVVIALTGTGPITPEYAQSIRDQIRAALDR